MSASVGTDTYEALRRRAEIGAVRAWALEQGIEVSRSGSLPKFVYVLFLAAHSEVLRTP